MLNIFKKKQAKGEVAIFKVNGMHCTSCGMNIDGELEDTEGVFSAHTNYAQGKTVVEFDPRVTSSQQLKKVISNLEYDVVNESFGR